MYTGSFTGLLSRSQPSRRPSFRPRLEELEARIEFAVDLATGGTSAVVFPPQTTPQPVAAAQQTPAFQLPANGTPTNAPEAIRAVQALPVNTAGATIPNSLNGLTDTFLSDPRGVGGLSGPEARFFATGQFVSTNDLLQAGDEPLAQTLLRENSVRTRASTFIPSVSPTEVNLALLSSPRVTLVPTANVAPLQALNPIDNLLQRGNPLPGMAAYSPFPILSAATVRSVGGGAGSAAGTGAQGTGMGTHSGQPDAGMPGGDQGSNATRPASGSSQGERQAAPAANSQPSGQDRIDRPQQQESEAPDNPE